MTDLLKRLHIWVGLFNFTALIVIAVTGISVTIPDLGMPAIDVRMVAYTAPGGLSDKELADDIWATLKLPLVGPIPAWAVHRNDANVLVLDFYSPNGGQRVTVLENEKTLRIERSRSSLGQFMSAMHGTTLSMAPPDVRMKLWALYVDLSIFSLLFMGITGVCLWLASRPRFWWAQISLAAGAGLFVVLWFVTR